MDFTEVNSRGKRGELLGRIDRQNFRFRTAKTIIIKLGLHAAFVELESAKNALNERSGGFKRVGNHWFVVTNVLRNLLRKMIATTYVVENSMESKRTVMLYLIIEEPLVCE
ncbi:uncharacterized protein TNCV_3942021 [Trichonephila clavipes]|uniref:Uncharacterized protein n=1 Tax=Trichonephila clavipes TaxID=2585209 RepID=A0A8X6VW32_TRICX|nr:uncharacterized protein TNCV_3942021 [Trichonephila clavipes]